MNKKRYGFRSIRWQMTLIYSVLMMVGFIAVLVSTSQIIQRFLLDRRIEEFQNSFSQIADTLPDYLYSKEGERLYQASQQYADQYKARVLIVDNNAVVQVDSRSQYNGWRMDKYSEVNEVLWNDKASSYDYHAITDDNNTGMRKMFNPFGAQKNWSVLFVQSIDYEGETIGALLMSVSIQNELYQMQSLLGSIGVVLLIVLIATVFLITILTRSITKPIADLTQVIRRVERGDFNQQVELKGSTEIVELGKTFNDMSKRLEQTDRVRNDFVSSASHEIKTPLATIKILVESLLYQDQMDEAMTREFLGDVNSEISRLDAVITDLLRLVQADKMNEDITESFVKIDARAICEDVAHRLQQLAHKKNITLEVDLQEAIICGDAIKFDQAIFNLVDNAIKYTDENGVVSLSCRAYRGECIIEIQDSGIGIPEEDVPKIFERFYRVDKARDRKTGGTGLGLSIVERMIKLHNGEIIVTSQENVGTKFQVRVPLAK